MAKTTTKKADAKAGGQPAPAAGLFGKLKDLVKG